MESNYTKKISEFQKFNRLISVAVIIFLRKIIHTNVSKNNIVSKTWSNKLKWKLGLRFF